MKHLTPVLVMALVAVCASDVPMKSAFAQQGYSSAEEANAGHAALRKQLVDLLNSPHTRPEFKAELRVLLEQMDAEHRRRVEAAFGPSSQPSQPQEEDDRAIGAQIRQREGSQRFTCQVQGKKKSADRFQLSISGCRAPVTGTTSQALNGKVFQSFSMNATGTQAEIQSAVAARLEAYIRDNRLNPSSDQEASVEITSMQIDAKGEKDEIGGELQGEVRSFVGEVLPITDTDRIALPVIFNYNAYVNIKKAMLLDVAGYIKTVPELMNKYGEDGQLLSLLTDDQLWPIALGAGHGAKAFFDLLKEYYNRQGPGKKVIFRTTDTNSKWVHSEFEGKWRHRVRSETAHVGIEYYGVPNSYLYVFRMIPAGANPNDVSNYAVVTRSPEIWRQSFSNHTYNDPNVTNNFSVAKAHGEDIISVIETARQPGWTIKRNWTTYSHLISNTVKKLY